jgi:hypothetical protein
MREILPSLAVLLLVGLGLPWLLKFLLWYYRFIGL